MCAILGGVFVDQRSAACEESTPAFQVKLAFVAGGCCLAPRTGTHMLPRPTYRRTSVALPLIPVHTSDLESIAGVACEALQLWHVRHSVIVKTYTTAEDCDKFNLGYGTSNEVSRQLVCVSSNDVAT